MPEPDVCRGDRTEERDTPALLSAVSVTLRGGTVFAFAVSVVGMLVISTAKLERTVRSVEGSAPLILAGKPQEFLNLGSFAALALVAGLTWSARAAPSRRGLRWLLLRVAVCGVVCLWLLGVQFVVECLVIKPGCYLPRPAPPEITGDLTWVNKFRVQLLGLRAIPDGMPSGFMMRQFMVVLCAWVLAVSSPKRTGLPSHDSSDGRVAEVAGAEAGADTASERGSGSRFSVSVPLLFVFVFSAAVWLIIGWARVASGSHYFADVVLAHLPAVATLGIGVSPWRLWGGRRTGVLLVDTMISITCAVAVLSLFAARPWVLLSGWYLGLLWVLLLGAAAGVVAAARSRTRLARAAADV